MGERITPAVLPVLFGAVLIYLALHLHGNALFLLLVFGVVEAFLILFATVNFTLATVVSDRGVQPADRKSRVIPWQEIDSFTAVPRKGRTSLASVMLVRADSSRPRPIELDGTAGSLAESQYIADGLNAILRSRRPVP